MTRDSLGGRYCYYYHQVRSSRCRREGRSRCNARWLLVLCGFVEVQEVLRLLARDDGLECLLLDLLVVAQAVERFNVRGALVGKTKVATDSPAFRAMVSAPMRPRPMKVSAGLW